MKFLTRFNLFLWYFTHFKVALIGYLKPKLLTIDDQKVLIKIPLTKRSKNHLNSMYFGAFAVGADLAGGMHGFYLANKAKCKVSLAFKSFHAQFLRRPESDVYFVCTMGDTIWGMITESKTTRQRINKIIQVNAFINYFNDPVEVANFNLELSLKVI